MKLRPNPAAWSAIPVELQERRQWLLATPDAKGDLKVPTSLDAQGNPIAGSSTDSRVWLDFKTACAAAAHHGLAIGYVLSADDPFSCIDLDVKTQVNEPDPNKWSSEAEIGMCVRTHEEFKSYTERSQSGQGLHIWVRAKIGDGVKRRPVEVYSQARFIVCTGDTVKALPIEERQVMLDLLVSEVRAAQRDTKVELNEDTEERYSDEEIVERLGNHSNRDKYFQLYRGDWQGLGYPSQSEADLALMSFYTFYSDNNEQCRRLFRMSKLGQRDKATKNDVYLNRTLKIVRGRQERDAVLAAHGEQIAAQLLANARNQSPPQAESAAPVPPTPAPQAPAPAAVQALTEPLPWPPGFVGAVARCIYESSPRPVREVSIVAALGMLAGICGRGWNIPQSGLNLYIILIARSAVGKEAMHSGISRIMQQMTTSMGPMGNPIGTKILEFVDFTEYVSGPALSKAIAFNPCFVNVSGEWGRRLKALSAEEGRGSGPLSSLRTVMTNLYQKSAAQSIVGGMGYSDKEKNVASTAGVAYSMIGETTPSTFYESLTEQMMEDGFLSRFTVIAYDGMRPEHNHTQRNGLAQDELNHLMQIVHYAFANKSGAAAIPVHNSPEAARMLAEFDKHCDFQINCTTDESWRQMWNRAHLKVQRISAVLAAADNPAQPVVTEEHVTWAHRVIMGDIGIMTQRLREGDVGHGDVSRERKVMTMLAEFLKLGAPGGYKLPVAMVAAGIVPRSYLQIRLQRISTFSAHPMGANRAMDDTLRSMVDSGYIIEVPKDKLATDYGFHGRAFRVVNLPAGYV